MPRPDWVTESLPDQAVVSPPAAAPAVRAGTTPARVKVAGQDVGGFWDPDSRTLYLPPWAPEPATGQTVTTPEGERTITGVIHQGAPDLWIVEV